MHGEKVKYIWDITLKWVLMTLDSGMWFGFICFMTEASRYGYHPSGSIRVWKFLTTK